MGIWTVSEILSILWKAGGACPPGGNPGVPRSMSLNAPYLKEQEYMVYGWGSERFPRYNTFYEMKRVGHAPGGPLWDPLSMSLNAPRHKELEYICFIGGDLNGVQDIMHFMNWRGWGMHPGEPLGSQDPCHVMCLIIRNENIYGLGRVFWTLSKLLCIFTFSHTNAYVTKFDLGLK